MSDKQFERLISELESISDEISSVGSTLFYISVVLVLALVFK